MIRYALLAAVLLIPTLAHAEDGHALWLRYARHDAATIKRLQAIVPPAVVVLGDGAPLLRARDEIMRGVSGMLGRELRVESQIPKTDAIVIGTIHSLHHASPISLSEIEHPGKMGSHEGAGDGYSLKTIARGSVRYTVIGGDTERGVLYGTFAYLRKLALRDVLSALDEKSVPANPVRWVNHWDNVDGTIERGYGGRSIFWEGGKVRDDLSAVNDYGRLLASLGIHAVSINNVNANPVFLSTEFLPQVARVANTLRPWGVRIALSIDFASPQRLGKLETFDPLDQAVVRWWKDKIDEIYKAVPDLAGIVLKADSEGRIGPSAYKRTHADAANVIARALKPHGGLFFYRGFVYDHKMDWRNLKNDRARAAHDNFKSLDGQFDDNVIIQIKHGPIDFQVREPASPLFGALHETNEAIELQITQEYFGQGRHTVFLVPMWKETLDFDMQVQDAGSPVKDIVSGKTWAGTTGGFVGVSNVGRDPNWFGNHLSQANLYGFGRLAWDPDLTARQIADEWTRQTFGFDDQVVETINRIQLTSWRTYENYTGPLGLQTLTDIVGNHYGVSVEASERNGWGQWHRADETGVGMDRTVATGTGFIGQYSPAVSKVYESLASMPDELLVFMHHVPYTHKLRSGKTVIQHIYDTHYDGADAVAVWVRDWNALKGRMDAERFQAVLKQLEYQAGQAIVWRDAVTRWFHKASGIADAKGRVGKYPGRIEAESAELQGYVATAVTPWEAGSGSGAVECKAQTCTATFTHAGAAGRHDILVQYFDVNTGGAKYRVRVGNAVIAEWTANDWFPARRLEGGSSNRKVITSVPLNPGDAIVVEGIPESGETAALDYIEVKRSDSTERR